MAVLRTVLTAAALLTLAGCGQKDTAKAPGEAAAPGAAPAAVAAGPVSAPVRKPGFWSQTVTVADFDQTSRICTDAAFEQKISVWGDGAAKEMCQNSEVTRTAGGYSFTSTCDMGTGGKTTTSGVATGDFNSKYRVDAESTTVGASAPQMNGARKMTVEATWLGPCPAGYVAGDMEVNGMKMNLAAMTGMKGGQ